MRIWLIVAIAGLVTLMLAVAVGVVFFQEQGKVRRTSQSPPLPPPPKAMPKPPQRRGGKTSSNAAEKAAEEEAERKKNPVLANMPDGDRSYSWEEVEQQLAQIRLLRKSIPAAMETLSSWYNFLGDPSFTKSNDYAEHVQRLEALIEKHPQAAALRVACATALLKAGWDARGTGPDDLVAEEGRRRQRELAGKGREFLERAIVLGVTDGEAHALLLEVARIEGWPLAEARAALDAGRKIDPPYIDLYSAMAEYLLPQWHGQPGDIERFAAEMFKTLPKEDGLDAYLHIAYAVHQYDSNLLFWGEYDRSLLAQCAELAIKRYAHTRNVAPFAGLCTIAAQDHAVASRIQPAIKHDDAPRIWLWGFLSGEFKEWAQSPDVASGRALWLWGPPLHHGTPIFSADSKSIWCLGGHPPLAVIRWDIASKRPVEALASQNRQLADLHIDESKKWIAAIVTGPSEHGWLLWKSDSPEQEPHFQRTEGACHALAIDLKSPRIAWAEEGSVHVLDMETKKELPAIKVLEPVRALRFSSDGKALSITMDSFAVWDLAKGERRYTLPAADNTPRGGFACEKILDFDEEGRLWTIGFVTTAEPFERLVVRLSADGKSHDDVKARMPGRQEILPLSIVVSADHRQFAYAGQPAQAGEPSPILVQNAQRRTAEKFPGHHQAIGAMTFSPDGKSIASVGQGGSTLRIWTMRDQ